MFAYCNNNPVFATDRSGTFPWNKVIFNAVSAGIIGFYVELLSSESLISACGAFVEEGIKGGISSISNFWGACVIITDIVVISLESQEKGNSNKETFLAAVIMLLSEFAPGIDEIDPLNYIGTLLADFGISFLPAMFTNSLLDEIQRMGEQRWDTDSMQSSICTNYVYNNASIGCVYGKSRNTYCLN